MTSPDEHPPNAPQRPAGASPDPSSDPTEVLGAAPAGPPPADGPDWLRQVRRLRRRRGGRVAGGVAGGLADYLRIDPVLVRLVFVALTPFVLTGLALYLVLWAFVPAEDARSSAGERVLARLMASPQWVRAALLVLAVVVAVAAVVPSSPGLLLVLIVLAVLLGRDRDVRAGNGGGAPAA